MKKIAITLMFTALMLSSCVREELMDTGGNIPEGEPALVSLKMDMAMMGSGAKSRTMAPEQENKIENLRVMIFDNKDNIVTNSSYADSPGTSINIKTYSGNNHKIYIVANALPAQDERLAKVNRLDRLKDELTTPLELGFGMNEDKPLIMTGQVEGVNVHPGTGNTLTKPVKLDFLAAKLTLIVKDATTDPNQKVTLLGWDVVDVPQKIRIFPNSTDYPLDVDKQEDWLSTSGYYPFEEGDDDRTGKMEVYLPENRRGGRVARALPSDSNLRYPGMDIDDQNDKGKTWYAPKRATHIVIYAMHKNANETKQVTAYIYLGEDNHSDYNLERGNHYTFTVTVKGLNDIRVDTNVDYIVSDFRIEHGVDLSMDSHPDYRPIRIHAPAGNATMEVLDESGRGYDDPGYNPPAWVKVSPLNLMSHQVKQSAPNDYWQQDAGNPGSFVRAKYIPHKSYRDENTSDYNVEWWSEAISRSDGGAGQEDDDVMKFADATHRMCYAITDIEFSDENHTDSRMLYIYADEFLNSGGSREAKIKFRFYKKGGNPNAQEEQTFTIRQEGYIPVFNEGVADAGLARLNEDGTPSGGTPKRFVIERVEESGLELDPSIPAHLQMNRLMQWGFSDIQLYMSADKYRNGYFLTANAVYNDVVRSNNEPTNFGQTRDSYRQMYDHGGGMTDKDPIPNYEGTTVGPYYYPTPANHKIYDPINNTSAARYCHEKNRDLNGDGIIDASETKWYLPSQSELQMIWIAGLQNCLNNLPYYYYWTVTEDGTLSRIFGNDKYANPPEVGVFNGTNRYNMSAVRCIRGL